MNLAKQSQNMISNRTKSANEKQSNSKLVYYIPLSIIIAKELEIVFLIGGWDFTSPSDNNGFIPNFIEWFGVLYGILLPLILVRAWEQLDAIDREFDREADTVRILYKDLQFLYNLPSQLASAGKEIENLLKDYVIHVKKNYTDEIKQSSETARIDGDKILERIREKFASLLDPSIEQTPVSELIIGEMFERLNDLIDNRGDRISLASQRLFENLRIIALFTSIIFLVPFYFAGLTSFFLFDLILILSVTFLVIYLYMIVEDLDEPFYGTRKITTESWELLMNEMKNVRQDGLQQNLITSLPSPQTQSKRKKSR